MPLTYMGDHPGQMSYWRLMQAKRRIVAERFDYESWRRNAMAGVTYDMMRELETAIDAEIARRSVPPPLELRQAAEEGT